MATDDGAFYDARDDVAGGTDNPWTDQADFDFRTDMPVIDAAPWSLSSVLSQSGLAS